MLVRVQLDALDEKNMDGIENVAAQSGNKEPLKFPIGKLIYRILFSKRGTAETICRVLVKRGLIEIIPWLPVQNKKQWALKVQNKLRGEYAYVLFQHQGNNKPNIADCLDALRMSLDSEADWEELA